MKIFSVVITAVVLVILSCVLCWPKVVLYLAKKAAARDFAKQRAELNTVPSSPPKVIASAAGFTNLVTVDVGGCALGLPAYAFTHDSNPKRQNLVLNHSRYRLLITPAFYGEEWDAVKQSVGQTNCYEFVRNAYNATETGIAKQRDMDALTRHVIFLKIKLMISPMGFEQSCIEFDRGDLKGFIIGDPARSKNLYIRFYAVNCQKFFDLGLIQKAHLQMSEIEELISFLSVRTNERSAVDASRASMFAFWRSRPGATQKM